MKIKTIIGILLLGGLQAQGQEYLYRVPDTPWAEGFGNHRAVIEVEKDAEAVRLDMKWRRPDTNPENKLFLIVDAETGDTIRNVEKMYVDNERCAVMFGPAKAGTYYFYYLPYQVQTGGGFYYGDYLPDNRPADVVWEKEWKQQADVQEIAKVKSIEARTHFDSFYPMEVIATSEEVAAYRKAEQKEWFLFPEDRKYPIRMQKYLPLRWMDYKQGKGFSGTAAPNEYYAFQIGIWSPDKVVSGLSYKTSDLKCGTHMIPATSITCFNLEGVDPKGTFFTKNIGVDRGVVQALWFGVDVPEKIVPGIYSGTVTLSAQSGQTEVVPVSICVEGKTLADRGDGEPWRHSRLRWLNSRLGEEDTPVLPYTEVALNGNRFSCLGREVVIDKQTALPKSITSWGTKVLTEPLRFIVETEQGVKHYKAVPRLDKPGTGSVVGSWQAEDKDLRLSCKAVMEFDGWLNYVYSLQPKADLKVKDIRLELPVSNTVAQNFLGAGLPGQETPDFYEGKWDTPEKTVNHFGVSIPVDKESNWLWPFDSFWIGNAHAGIHCELRGSTYSGPLLNSYRPAYPDAWHNQGKGGFKVEKKPEYTLVTVYSGERNLKEGEKLDYDFSLLVTPVKKLNVKSQFTDRYYHNGAAPVPTDEDVKAGVRIINIHHANVYNPYINYPFLTSERLKDFIGQWHQKGCKVKLYYTLRELTSVVTEMWAIRSLGTEILRDGAGGGYPWCREHLISGYTPQWYQHFDENEVPIGADAALLTSESDSRWYNYYVEGLKWMVQNLDIDGIYLDDVSFGRDILKRMRRAMESVKPGCIIDLHSNTGFSRGPANQYAEFFPYIDKLWFGESFLYDKMTPANWLVESSGIPFGLMGDMLYRGGNKWLGMQYGMTVRHPWMTEGVVCDPRVIWKVWDEFGIEEADMIGFWEEDVPVKTSDEAVKVTVYKKNGKILLSIGNYSDETKRVNLHIDWKKLGMEKDKTEMVIPEIPTFQEACQATLADSLVVAPRKGWLVYLISQEEK